MGLPSSRDLTFIPGTSRWPAVTANLMQDLLISLAAREDTKNFGSGVDGALHVTAGTTTLTGHKNCTSIVVDALTAIQTKGFVMWGGELIDIAGIIDANGADGAAAVGGAATGPHGASGAAGGTATGSSCQPGILVGLGGNGGNGGAGNSGTVPAGFRSVVGTTTDYLRHPYITAALAQNAANVAGLLDVIRGGGAGGGGGGSSGAGGGGGGGGYLIVLMARSVIFRSTATISADGGDGGAANGGGNGGGGGGGGGGAVLIVCETFDDQGATFSMAGGAGGAHAGNGADGSAGSAGNTTPYVVTVPAWPT